MKNSHTTNLYNYGSRSRCHGNRHLYAITKSLRYPSCALKFVLVKLGSNVDVQHSRLSSKSSLAVTEVQYSQWDFITETLQL